MGDDWDAVGESGNEGGGDYGGSGWNAVGESGHEGTPQQDYTQSSDLQQGNDQGGQQNYAWGNNPIGPAPTAQGNWQPPNTEWATAMSKLADAFTAATNAQPPQQGQPDRNFASTGAWGYAPGETHLGSFGDRAFGQMTGYAYDPLTGMVTSQPSGGQWPTGPQTWDTRAQAIADWNASRASALQASNPYGNWTPQGGLVPPSGQTVFPWQGYNERYTTPLPAAPTQTPFTSPGAVARSEQKNWLAPSTPATGPAYTGTRGTYAPGLYGTGSPQLEWYTKFMLENPGESQADAWEAATRAAKTVGPPPGLTATGAVASGAGRADPASKPNPYAGPYLPGYEGRSGSPGAGVPIGNNAAVQVGAIEPGLAAWLAQLQSINPVALGQSTMNWQPGAIPEQYRSAADAWLRARGYRPTGSLGQYGYTTYQVPTGGPPTDANTFTPDMLNSITDDSLRAWMAYYLSKAGLLQGTYAEPTS